jgi:hypothetical protein
VQYVAVVNNLHQDDPLNGEGSVTVLENNPLGRLSRLATLRTRYGPTQVQFGNFGGADPDGTDLVVLDDSNRQVSVFLNTGAGSWANPVSVKLGGVAAKMVAADLDLDPDGLQDLVFTIPKREEIVTLVNQGGGVFTEMVTPAKGNLGQFVVAELDNDASSYPDLAVLRPIGGDLFVWSGNGDGTFSAASPASFDGLEGPTYLVAGDLDGDLDGYIDLAVVSTSVTRLTVLLNRTGAADFKVDSTIPLSETPGRVFAGDVDANAAGQDLVVVHARKRYVTVMRSKNANYSSFLETTTRNPLAVVMGDLTDDADPDLIIAEEEQRLLAVLAGNGSGGFKRSEIGFTSHPTFVTLVELDGLGKLDLVMLQPRADRLVYLLNEN